MVDWSRPKSVRAPLIAIISVILVAGFSVTNLVSYYVSKTEIRASLANSELPLTSDNIYSEIQRDLLPPVFVSSVMATDTFVQDWLKKGELTPVEMTRYLDEIRRKYGFFTSFLVSEESRKYYHFSGISQVVSQDDSRDEWYFRVRSLDQSYELNVDFNEEQGDALTIFINYRVVDETGELLAVTGVGLDVQSVSKIVDRYKDHFGRHVYFLDEDGNILVRSEGATLTESNISLAAGISVIAEEIMATEHGGFEYERDGEVLLLSTRNIPELKLRVLVEQSESDALEGIFQSTLTNLIVGLAVIMVTLLVVVVAVNRFHSRLEWMATRDSLTGLVNRGVFDASLERETKLLKRDPTPFSLILFDIDHFKRINDGLGHLNGDRILQAVANVTSHSVRDSDLLCRWGGEEFVILVSDCDVDSAMARAETIRTSIEESAEIHRIGGAAVTVSLGVTEARVGDTPDDILARADKALYEAKEQGRNQACRA